MLRYSLSLGFYTFLVVTLIFAFSLVIYYFLNSK